MVWALELRILWRASRLENPETSLSIGTTAVAGFLGTPFLGAGISDTVVEWSYFVDAAFCCQMTLNHTTDHPPRGHEDVTSEFADLAEKLGIYSFDVHAVNMKCDHVR